MEKNQTNFLVNPVFIYLFYPHMRICLLILEKRKGGEKHQCERETLMVVSHMHPDQEQNPQLRHVL